MKLLNFGGAFDTFEHLKVQKCKSFTFRIADDGTTGVNHLVLGSRVILCTIGMLSADRVMECGFTDLVPVQTVIVDEASQIQVGDYLPMLAKYKTSLRKMVFVGDDKQRECLGVRVKQNSRGLTLDPHTVAPYGQEEIQELRSVFEWPHLMENSVFLDTQCVFIFSPV